MRGSWLIQFHDSFHSVERRLTGASSKPDGSNEVLLIPQIPGGIVRVSEQLEEIFGPPDLRLVNDFDGISEMPGSHGRLLVLRGGK